MKANPVGAAVLMLIASNAIAAEKWGPTWSEVTGNLWSKTQMNRTAAVIRRIDGRDKTDRIVKIEPGKRSIVVGPPMRKGFTGDDATLDVDVAPCQRYYINAQFASGMGTEWKPVLAKVEKIPGCKAPKAP